MPTSATSTPRRGGIRRSDEFRSILRQGGRLIGERVVLYARPSGMRARAGFVCGRAVGNAVDRNRAKRLLREAWRALAEAAVRFDVVFVARPEIRGAELREVQEDMERVLRSAGVIRP